MWDKSSNHNTKAAHLIANEYEDRKDKNSLNRKKQLLHDRINKRAQRTQNESTADILNDIDDLLNS